MNILITARKVLCSDSLLKNCMQIDKRIGLLQPGEKTECNLSTCLDESKRFKDTLHILVTEGADIDVVLTAVGIGCTVVCPELNAGSIDFGDQFTGRQFFKELLLHNLDRRPVNLMWINETAQLRKKQMSSKALKQSKDADKRNTAQIENVQEQVPFQPRCILGLFQKQTLFKLTRVTTNSVQLYASSCPYSFGCRSSLSPQIASQLDQKSVQQS